MWLLPSRAGGRIDCAAADRSTGRIIATWVTSVTEKWISLWLFCFILLRLVSTLRSLSDGGGDVSRPAAFLFFFRSSCRWFSRSFARVRTRFQNNVPCLFYAACKNQMDGVQPRQQMPGSLDRPLEGVSKQCSALADWKHRNHINITLKYFTFCILVVYLKYVICNLTLHTQAERHTYMLSYIILQMTWSDRSTGI